MASTWARIASRTSSGRSAQYEGSLRQRSRHDLDEHPQIATIVVAHGGACSSRKSAGSRSSASSERQVKLAAVHLAGRGATLVDAVEEVPDDLVRDEETKEVAVASPGNRP